jgi:Ser/Thr protein kinase RdoA (MazF antagonist)
LGPFHARWWGKRAPAHEFPRSARDDSQARQTQYAGHAVEFLERYRDALPSALLTIVELLRSRLARVLDGLANGPQTLIHGDFHLDNLIFSARGSDRSVVVLDWQTAVVSAPAWDLALFLFGSLTPADRRAAEGPLLDRYAALLAANGVSGYSGERLRHDCRLALLALFAGTIGWIARLETHELADRERALQEAVIADGRLVSALLDHDVADLPELRSD